VSGARDALLPSAAILLAAATLGCEEPSVAPPPAPTPVAARPPPALPKAAPDPAVQPEASPDGKPLLQVTSELVGKYVRSHEAYAVTLGALAKEIREKKQLAADDAKALTLDPEFRERATKAAEAASIAAGLTVAEEARVAQVVEEVMVARHFGRSVERVPEGQRDAARVLGESKLLTVRRKFGDAQVDAVLAHEAALTPLPDQIARALGIPERPPKAGPPPAAPAP